MNSLPVLLSIVDQRCNRLMKANKHETGIGFLWPTTIFAMAGKRSWYSHIVQVQVIDITKPLAKLVHIISRTCLPYSHNPVCSGIPSGLNKRV